MSLPLILLIAFATFITSLISGVFGMAGGMILKAVFLTALTVETSMILHAIIQLVANGWRCFIWRDHVVLKVLPPYFIGVVIGVAIISSVTFVPSAGMAFIVMGAVPLISMAASRIYPISILHKGQTIVASILLTIVQMTAGVIGPLLDLLYNTSPLTRQQIVATKAFSQTVMHLVRLGYYSALIPLLRGSGEGWPPGLSPWVVGVFIAMSIAGTSLAAPIVKRLDDKKFKKISKILILLISFYCLIQGVYLYP